MNLNSEAIKKNDVEIAINNVSVVFKDNQGNDVKALDNIDFDIHKGEFISLLGPSGCGKTTLLRTIADLLEPTSGNVRVSNMTPKEIRLMQKFGIVFQNPVLFEWRTVKKNIELPLEIMGYWYWSRWGRQASVQGLSRLLSAAWVWRSVLGSRIISAM